MSDRMEELRKIAAQHIGALNRHFDTCHVFLTIYDASTGETESMTTGFGNFLARYGQTREWVIQQEERARHKTRNDEDDEE